MAMINKLSKIKWLLAIPAVTVVVYNLPKLFHISSSKGIRRMQTGSKTVKVRSATGVYEHHTTDKVRAVTYNVWFEQLAKQKRAECLIEMLRDVRADVICLQEITSEVLQIITSDSWVTKNYHIADPNGEMFEGYGLVILSTFPFSSVNCWHYNDTSMGRYLLEGQIVLPNKKRMHFGCVHLESLNQARRRREQLIFSTRVLEQQIEIGGSEGGLLMGDFNFDGKRNWDIRSTPLENLVMKEISDWKDVWEVHHPDSDGFTFDTTTNEMIASMSKERMRYDRILSFKLSSNSISIIGNTPMIHSEPEALYPYHQVYNKDLLKQSQLMNADERQENETFDRMAVYISDHYGLLAEFNI